MKIYSDKIVQKARRLRKKNFSYREIGKILNISDSTIRKWCFDIQAGKGSSLREIRRNEKIRREIFRKGKRFIKRLNFDKISQEQARLLVSLLYWCEGAKYPVETRVNFVNSNEQMMKTFIQLLRKGFDLDEKKFRAHLQIHDTHDFMKLRKYWSKLLNISEAQFIKPTITKPTGNRHRNNYKGTCTLRYYDCQILLRLSAIYENFALVLS